MYALCEERPFEDLLAFLDAQITDLGARGDAPQLHFLMIHMLQALDPKGASEYQLKLVRRKAGKPIDKRARADRAYSAVVDVERAIAEGLKQEAAIAQASADWGMSRAEIFKWLRFTRTMKDPALASAVVQAQVAGAGANGSEQDRRRQSWQLSE